MRLLTALLASLRDDSAGMISHKLLGMPTTVMVSPLSLGIGGVEVTDRPSSKRSVRPMEAVEAELRAA